MARFATAPLWVPGVFGVLGVLAAPAAAQDLRLSLPVACAIGQSCFIQHYVDTDPGKAARDHRCGTLTYDGHDGTDFRVPTLAAQRAGVDVLAAAPGRVLRLRDGVPDISARDRGRLAVEGSECGNGLILAHVGGWETQYCHLARGSIAVKPGEMVGAGQRLGRVGMSGLAEFPHLHFTLRRNGKIVDPFAPQAAPGTCSDSAPSSLWDDKLKDALAYRAGSVINAGFATGALTMALIDEGKAADRIDQNSPALVAFVRAIGLRQGDVQTLSLIAPDGSVLRENSVAPLESNKAQYMVFVGAQRPVTGWRTGRYRAAYTVFRDGKPAIEHSFSVDLAP